MNKKNLSFLLFFFLLSYQTIAQPSQEKYCAVLDFTIGENVTEEEGRRVSDAFRKYFHPTGYIMLDGTDIRETLQEETMKYIYDSPYKNLVSAGYYLGVSDIVQGHVYKSDQKYVINVMIVRLNYSDIDVRSVQYLSSEASIYVEIDSSEFLHDGYLYQIKKLSSSAMYVIKKGIFNVPTPEQPHVKSSIESLSYELSSAINQSSTSDDNDDEYNTLNSQICNLERQLSVSEKTNNNGDIATIYDTDGNWLCTGMFVKTANDITVRIHGKKYNLIKSDKSDYRYKTVPDRQNESFLYVK